MKATACRVRTRRVPVQWMFCSQIIDTGGDTKCKDFTTQDEKKQTEEVSKMLKDKSGADPASLQVTATRLSAATYCQTLGKPDTKISEAPH